MKRNNDSEPVLEAVVVPEGKVDFDAVGDKYLLFVQTSTQLTSADDYIDKVIVSEKPACEPVLDFEVNNVTSYTAQVKVLDEGVTTCEVSFSGSGVAPNAGKIISSDSCVIEVEGLLAETTYDVMCVMYVELLKENGRLKK